MEGSRGTASLRAMAPQWSLAGDKQLLSVLQNIHENVINRCTQANAELEEMTMALNDASISLQNVNNKLMALSNTQFVESRVYEDDFEIANETVKMDEPKNEVASKSEMQKIIEGLKVVERMHEPVHIVGDSDSDTDNYDSDDGDRVVLKLKDFYSHRPLPHIIGSAAWSNKWHVGLMPDDSDSDSSTSRPPKEAEEYSDSEPERDFVLPDAVTVSDVPTPVSVDEDENLPKISNPADVAAQLSRKLLAGAETFQGGSHLRNSWEEPAPIARSNEPTTSRIFSDEPPPIDRWGSDTSDDEDIFAEIHKSKPYANRDRAHSAARDLFGEDPTDGDVAQTQIPQFARPVATEQIFFADHHASREEDEQELNVKKPVGGISVFGSSKGAEGIKAAITKRNTRGSSISDNEGASVEPVPEKDNDKPNEKDIFKNLFKDVKTKKDTVATDEYVKQEEKKIDLFSDNIFDDIDNIFVNKVKLPSKDKKEDKKSIFDDIDDLFAEVTTAKSNNELPKNVMKQEKGLFDSDDDLFSENSPKIIESKIEVHESTKVKVNNVLDENSDLSISNSKPKGFHSVDKIIEGSRDLHKNEDNIKSDNQFDDNHNENVSINIPNNDSSVVYDSINTSNSKDEANRQEVKSINVQNSKQNEQNVNVKSSLFDDDEEIDDLFQTSSKNHEQKLFKTNADLSEAKDVLDVINNEKDNSIRSNVDFKPLDSFSNQADTPTDIFDSVNNEVVQNISSILNREIENETREASEINTKTDCDNKQNTIKQTDTLIAEPQDSDYNDIFNDQPPEFEKPTEPKKSKNINALFDDDSDDEALFFKKNDANLDESHDFSSNHNNLFGIFHDEPPALDVDFAQKSNNDGFSDSHDTLFSPQPIHSAYTEERDIRNQTPSVYKNTQGLLKEATDTRDFIQTINVDLPNEKMTNVQLNNTTSKIINETPENERTTRKDISSDLDISDDELFNYKPKETSNQIKSDQLKHSDNEENDNAQLKNKDFIDEKIDHISQKIEKKSDNVPPVPHFDISDEELFTSASNFKEKDITDCNKVEVIQTADSLRSDSKIDSNKSIGKLKQMNIKINVNTLLPGASPKKVPKSDQTDGQRISIQSNEKLNTDITLKNEPTMIKSVNFEGDSNSNMLDNKISKERAKIQIKRRPSTRKARREAVRRSAIDFADDSTDNSSSIDDKPNDVNAIRQPDKASDIVTTRVTEAAHNPIFEPKDEVLACDNNDVITNRQLDKHVDQSSLRDEADIKTLDKQSKEHKEIGLAHKSENIRSNEVVSKVTRTVYILNDEDIFSTTKNDTKNVKSSNDATLKTSRDDDLFKNVTSSTKSDGVKTLGQVYSSANELDANDEDLFKTESKHRSKSKTKSLFDDLSDEENELFNGGVKTKSVFNSGSDEDLFGKSKRDNRYDGAQKEKKESKSLFGDADDNDDIFGAKRKIRDNKSQPSKSNPKPEVNVNAEPVFEDPLSLFSNRDD